MLLLAAWVHDVDPFLIRFSGNFGLRWYGISYIAAFLVCWVWLRALAKRELIRLSPEAVGDAILACVLGVMIGGRLGYILIYDRSLLGFDGSFPWWGVLDISSGGMASHGGIIGLAVAALWIARRNKVPFLHVGDCLSAVAPAGVVLGRLANFVNGELLGRIVSPPGAPAPWWSVRFPQELLHRSEEATSLYTEEQWFQYESLVARFTGADGSHRAAIARIIEQVQSGDAALKAELAPLLTARHPSQLYQSAAEGLLTLAVVWFVWRKPRKPGVVLGVVIVVYAIGRFATDLVRLPDTGIPVVLGLSRGQWLSVAMIGFAAVILGFAHLRSTAAIGGWRTKTTPPPIPSR